MFVVHLYSGEYSAGLVFLSDWHAGKITRPADSPSRRGRNTVCAIDRAKIFHSPLTMCLPSLSYQQKLQYHLHDLKHVRKNNDRQTQRVLTNVSHHNLN